jgi:hypothetical protein
MGNIAIINEEKYKILMNGGKVFVGRKPLEHGESIFTGGLIGLSHGEVIETKGVGRNSDTSYFFKLDENIPFRTIMTSVLRSSLNEIFSVKELFMMQIPDKDIFMQKLESVLED